MTTGMNSAGLPSQRILLQRRAFVPDPLKIARCQKTPELGPRLLFFSGGTALKRFSKVLIRYTHNSIHIITPFDSGGSSAEIRRAFRMLSIGDVRNRLMALADQSIQGNPEIYRLFSYRLPGEDSPDRLRKKLQTMAAGLDSLIDGIPAPMRSIICLYIQDFLRFMPDDFNLRGANIGNMVLSAGYLNHHRQIETVIYLFSRLVEVRGQVRPVVADNLHLAATLQNGETLVGQHRITGDAVLKARSPIRELFLSASADRPERIQTEISPDAAALIDNAEIICYPMGSFYSSIMANLLPRGVGAAVAGNRCPKAFIPNTVPDPEQYGMSLSDIVGTMIRCLQAGHPGKPTDYLDWIILDRGWGKYPFDLDLQKIKDWGIGILDVSLVTQESFPYVDPERLCSVLLSLT
jgi:CofD-related protein of GAK system